MSRSPRLSLHQLNPQQRTAVQHLEGPLLILAGAGTGKTRVITNRIAWMVASGVDPETILAVTFTNKAANEMRERVASTLPGSASGSVLISTFHSLCVRILRESIDRLGYKKNFSIYSGKDQSGLVRKLINRHAAKDEKMEPGQAIALISKAKNQNFPVSERSDSLIACVYRSYQENLKLLNAVDFDDLLILAERVLSEHADLREHWRQRFHYSMVDEFQDTNSLQMRLLQNLVNDQHNICVVGDDDQSIYGWRGADISNILDFERFFPNPEIVKLEENYRSTNPILHTANSLIRHNLDRREKRLWSGREHGERLRLVGFEGDKEEAAWVVNEIQHQKGVYEAEWEDFAILFRMNLQSRVFEQELRERKIPYRIIGGQSFFDRREVKDLLAYLTVINNPEDDGNLLRIINLPTRGIGRNTIETAQAYSMGMEISIFEALSSLDFTRGLTPKARQAVEGFVALIEGWRMQNENFPHACGELGTDLIEEIGYKDDLRRHCKDEKEWIMRLESLGGVLETLKDYETKKGKKQGLQGFLDDIALASDREDEDISEKKGVCLITLHAAKGLEFPEVYLVGLEDGILPHRRSLDEGRRDEERRLLYVGITRAMRRLTMSYCVSRMRYGDPMPCQPSSFLEELDKEFIDESLPDEDLDHLTEEDTGSAFDSMRAMLSNIDGHKVE
ncbi:MAG: UvrD-helicase domain-containing protein [Verrucomicrobiota bacterium]